MYNNEKVSVIIPSYNRFYYLMNTIKSINNQTYSDFEIIVVNDCSTQKEYYTYNWGNVKIVHLPKNSKDIFGYVSMGYVRNQGVYISKGKYIAFCDDDDMWFPRKLELQINAMKKYGCKMSSTEGLIGKGPYNENKKYPKYNSELHFEYIQKKFKNCNSNLLDYGYPDVWTSSFLKIHNCIISCSAIIEKEILEKINFIGNLPPAKEDYDCWLRALEHTNCVYIQEPCIYYDDSHGDGVNY